MDSSYLTSAAKSNQLPILDSPEIALLGRSNCGKSTLLNKIVGRRSLARTSSTPGRTQMANFFALKPSKESQIVLIDLPGYGYAKSSRGKVSSWDKLVRAVLQRSNLAELWFLADIRRRLDDLELEFLASVEQLVVVLTKSDKVSQREQKKALDEWRLDLQKGGVEALDFLVVSSLKGRGINHLVERISKLPAE